ncbi:IclR family transcriptional regulator [Aquabacterium sp.]|uniref:IclR family transcriptional regulator n=1 Tax=Aquabacterium sp. TaxID=1872578 RepID=UPI0035C6ADFF
MNESSAASTSIQVLSRMFSLLDTLAQEGDSVSLKSISEQTGLHPSTAHRILNDLAVGGMVERSGPGSYRLGLRLLELGNRVRVRLDVRELSARPMQELHRQTGHTVSLFIRQDDDAICVARTVSERSGVQVTRVMGLRIPLTSHAAGKLLMLQDPASLLQVLASAQGVRLESLQAELAAIRAQGMALDSDSPDPLLQLAATPIHDDMGRVCAALVLNAPIARFGLEWQEALKATAARISACLGWVHR